MMKSIQISDDLQHALSKMKLSDRDTYEDLIWDMIEDHTELNKQTKEEIEQARADIKAGKGYSFAQIKKELGV